MIDAAGDDSMRRPTASRSATGPPEEEVALPIAQASREDLSKTVPVPNGIGPLGEGAGLVVGALDSPTALIF